MNEARCYIEIANRSLESAERLIAIGKTEHALFAVYHAFESTGAALISHNRRTVPKSHKSKLNDFLAVSRKHGNLNRNVRDIICILSGVRNACLYPTKDPHTALCATPLRIATRYDTNRLMKRVRHVLQSVEYITGIK